MHYNLIVSTFCERKIFPNQPEYLNALTALFLCYISLKNLWTLPITTQTSLVLYNCLFSNGIGSFLYHWYGWYIFKLVDEMTMIIAIWLGIGKILSFLDFPRYQICLFSIVNHFLISFIVFPWFDSYFPIIFLCELLLLIPLCKVASQRYPKITPIYKKGIVICCLSGLTWGLTETKCNKYFIFGHGVWHIGMGIGLSSIINFFNTIIINSYT